MGWKGSATDSPNSKICVKVFLGLVVLFLPQFALGVTNPNDVAAINSLYAAFGNPLLPGWVSTGGDPCGEAWQGVQCDTTNNIVSINLVGANLGGGLGDNLGSFSSLKLIDLSNNRIGGSIPSSLPITMENFFLSGNNFTGSIPSSLSSLTHLSALKFNDNHLTGEIPDAFGSLSGLASIDLSNNNLSGKLPPSMGNLSSLASLHLQSNQLSGTLDVLQGLPLQDLDIRNNLFAGPIPDKLQSIPNFKKDGNPFNITPSVSPVPPPSAPSTPSTPSSPGNPSPSGSSSHSSSGSASPSGRKTKPADSPTSSQIEPVSGGNSKRSHKKKIVLISIASVMGFIILILALLLCIPSCFRKSKEVYRTYRQEEIPSPYKGARENVPHSVSAVRPNSHIEIVEKANAAAQKDLVSPEVRRIAAVPTHGEEKESYSQRMGKLRKQDSEMSDTDLSMMMPPPPPHPPPPPFEEKVIVKPVAPVAVTSPLRNQRLLTSVKSFTIASLQQYTNSFSEDNRLGTGMLGSVYRAELPNGKLLAVKKLEKDVCSRQKDYEFIELVNNIDRIRHAHVVELVGYCMEHGQRLLVYEYCSNGTLLDALHAEEEHRNQLSWNTRMRMALGAARALEYLHEVYEPPIIHRNFKSMNILLDDDLSVHVSDCGLAPLIALGSVTQLSGNLQTAYSYGAPEFESGIYTPKSDVYSFGVVMLELLTGRMCHDSARSRGEQYLVRWAIPQLHDIDALSKMVDPSLEGAYPAKSLSHFADIISRCVQSGPEFRPLMSEVVQDLQSMLQKDPPQRGVHGGNFSG